MLKLNLRCGSVGSGLGCGGVVVEVGGWLEIGWFFGESGVKVGCG